MPPAVPTADTRSLTSLLRLAIGRGLTDIHTALPGIVETYDAGKRRARVIPAIAMLLDDGELLARPPITDVPVIFPSGGGLTMAFPLPAGEPVLLVFAQRGLGPWKGGYQSSPPGDGPILDMSDAVCLAGFGALAIRPATDTGASLQSDDGLTAVIVEPTGEVVIKAAGDTRIEAGGETTLVATGDATIRTDGAARIHADGPLTLTASQINLLPA